MIHSICRRGCLCLIPALLGLGAVHAGGPDKLNVPPKGFRALFNGKDLTGWKGR